MVTITQLNRIITIVMLRVLEGAGITDHVMSDTAVWVPREVQVLHDLGASKW